MMESLKLFKSRNDEILLKNFLKRRYVINDNLNMYINDHLRMYTSDYALI